MTRPSAAVLIALLTCFSAANAGAQTPPAAPAQPAKAAAAQELNGYKQAAWGMSPDEVKTALNLEFANSEPNTALTELPWEVMRLTGIAESAPDELLGEDLNWYYGETQDVVLGFYKNRFFFYLSALDKILPAAEYEKKLAAKHGARTKTLSFKNTDPAEDTVLGAYELALWEKKKTTVALGMETLYPEKQTETNYDIVYLGADILGEFQKAFTAAMQVTKDAEKKLQDKAVQEQQKKALEVIQ